MNVLHLDSSILGEASASRKLTREVIEQLRAGDPELAVVHRDLAAQPIAHLSGEVLATRGTAAQFLNAFQAREAKLDADLHAELQAADVLVIGAPLYNFSVPTGLKAWIDRIAVAGKTFRYTDKGPEGLVKGKRAIVVATSGGIHADTPVDGAYVGYLKGLLAFIGITDVEVVRAEGLAVSDQVRAHAMAKARGRIRALQVALPA
ncbi:MAG TPA: NAD(P)H-dependent oxidoreductase [Burkholderiales bacterium]|nr:NAD(P)H-dependent oxidoreductase [Burkholderiales bacterium]